MTKTYLRTVTSGKHSYTRTDMQLFEGDIIEDRQYWAKHHTVKVRYFELKEV